MKWERERKRVHIPRTHRVALACLGLIFLVVGGLLLCSLARTSYGFWRTRVPLVVNAQVQSVERRLSGSGRFGRSSTVLVRYTYRYKGEVFEGHRVALLNPPRDAYWRLLGAFDRKKSIPVFLDADHPGFSVIYRDFSWSDFALALLVSLGFSGMGGFVVWMVAGTTRSDNVKWYSLKKKPRLGSGPPGRI